MENPLRGIMNFVRGKKTAESLPVPQAPDMLAINKQNEGKVSTAGGPEALEGAANAALAGKPIAAEWLAADAAAKGMTVPENLSKVATNNQAKMEAQNQTPTVPLNKTA